jgi:thiol oxidase
MTYLKRLLSKINDQSIGLTGSEFRVIADINTPDGYLPSNRGQYHYCSGSSPQYRGYPCALWVLFHTLTVSQVHLGLFFKFLFIYLFIYLFRIESDRMNAIEVPSAIKNYINIFFGCRHCSENFMKETEDINQLESKTKHEAVIYLWKSKIYSSFLFFT